MGRKSAFALQATLLFCLSALCAGAQGPPLPQQGARFDATVSGTRARQDLHHIDNDDQRAYWLITPSGRRTSFHNFNPVMDFPPRVPLSLQPGLIVALGTEGSGQDALDFWMRAEEQVFHGRYLIAVPIAPSWSRETPTPWLTRGSLHSVPEAGFATEDFLSAIVKDVRSAHTLNPDHIFLHGVGSAGLAAYAASLEENTPFKGFYILSSTFRSLQLPSLSHAHGRRYLIQHSEDDKESPYWMAAAARKLLLEQGATVKLDTLHGGHGYTLDTPWKHVQSALTWLEKPGKNQ